MFFLLYIHFSMKSLHWGNEQRKTLNTFRNEQGLIGDNLKKKKKLDNSETI